MKTAPMDAPFAKTSGAVFRGDERPRDDSGWTNPLTKRLPAQAGSVGVATESRLKCATGCVGGADALVRGIGVRISAPRFPMVRITASRVHFCAGGVLPKGLFPGVAGRERASLIATSRAPLAEMPPPALSEWPTIRTEPSDTPFPRVARFPAKWHCVPFWLRWRRWFAEAA